MDRMKEKSILRRKRAMRRRKKCQGNDTRPRLTIYRSHKHIYAQLVDDISNKTVCSLSSLSSDVKKELKKDGKKTDVARVVGTKLGEESKKNGIERVICDVGAYKFHGRVKALIEGFQKSGIKL